MNQSKRRRRRLERVFAAADTTLVMRPDGERGGFHETVIAGGVRTGNGVKGGRVVHRGYSAPGQSPPHEAIAATLTTTISGADRLRSRSRPAGGRPAGSGRRRAGSSRAGPDDDSGEPEPPRRWQPDHLLRDVADYLGRLGPQGAERDWLIDQLEFLGYPRERVSAALALAVADGRARRGRGEDGVDVVWGRS